VANTAARPEGNRIAPVDAGDPNPEDIDVDAFLDTLKYCY
jgi:hypothetical protein